MKHPIPVTLSQSDQAALQTFIHAGKANARTFTRARVLLKAAEGWTDQQICAALDISRNTSIRVRQLYPGSADWRPCCTTSDNSAIVRP
jgi:Homeodomain-like domain